MNIAAGQASFTRLHVAPLTPHIGAEIAGVDDPNWVKGKLAGLQERVTEILRRAKTSGKTPQAVAVEMVRERLAAAGERSVASEPAPAT